MRRQRLEIGKHHHRFRPQQAGGELAKAQRRRPAPVKAVALGLGIEDREVEADVETKDQLVGQHGAKARQDKRQGFGPGHHRVGDAMDPRTGGRDRQAGIDQRVKGFGIRAADGADLDDPVASRAQARRLKVERDDRHPVQRHRG